MSSETRGASNPRVAVDVLVENQRDVLFRGAPDRDPPLTPLVDPFDSRRELINWWQAASVRTFGHLSGFFPATALLRDAQLVDALVGPGRRGDDHIRERLVEKSLEAAHRSYRDVEVRANEWLSSVDDRDRHDDFTEIDPTQQSNIAMRPAFSRLDAQQATALSELWDGFTDRQALSRWVHTLPSVADFSGVVDTSLPRMLAASDHTREMLQQDGTDGEQFRERFAAGILLPAFGRRARGLRAGETVDDSTSDSEVPLA